MKKLAILSLLLAGPAWAQFTDDFNRATEDLEDSANWTCIGGANCNLSVASNRLEDDDDTAGVRLHAAADQGSANIYVQSDTLFTGVNNERLAIRAQDNTNFIWLQGNNTGNNCVAGIRVSSSDTTWFTENGCSAQTLRIEAEGTTIRFYVDEGAGLNLIHTQTGVTTFQTETGAGYWSASSGGLGNGLWDNFEVGVLAPAGHGSIILCRRTGRC